MFAQWAVYLSSFDFDTEHRPGKQNLAADALFRTVFPDGPAETQIIQTVFSFILTLKMFIILKLIALSGC